MISLVQELTFVVALETERRAKARARRALEAAKLRARIRRAIARGRS